MSKQIKPYWQNYIDGSYCDGGAGRITVYNPGNGLPLAEQALADSKDIDRAVKAAKACHESGSLTAIRPVELGRMVKKIGEYLDKHADEIANLLCLESGKPLWEAHQEVAGASRYFEYYGNQAETMEGRSIPLGESYFDFTVYEPFGVSAMIIPWNYPLEMTARSLSAALATGNTCVIKTPELDPLCSAYFADAAEAAGFPPGAVNILCGHGHEAGAALSNHSEINQLVFTGSVPTGIMIAKAAAANVVPCVLELGGKSAAIVYPDADLDNLIENMRWGIFYNAGQVCSAMSRLIVHESIIDNVIEAATERARKMDVGPGIERTNSGNNMGAMISRQQRDRAVEMCQESVKAGAIATTGGEAVDHDGDFLKPTILKNITPDMSIAQDEVFGPVLSAISFKDDEQAIEIANGTDYGLVSGVFTRDLDRAMTVAKKMCAGQVFVNEWFAGGVETPFGGYGKSGYGREKGREALMNYVQTKNIAIKLGS